MSISPHIREILLAVGVVFCVGYAWLSVGEVAPNERARIYLSVSLVDRGDVSVDEEVGRFGKNWDLSRKDGEWYSNKPPGASLLGAAAYGFVRTFTDRETWSIEALFQLMRVVVMLPLALLGFVAIRRWMELLDLSDATVDIASLAWMMGSAAFHYSGAFFSHHVVAVFLVCGLWLLEWTRQQVARTGPVGWREAGWMFAAGASLGMAGLTEYQAGVSCALIAFWVLVPVELRRLKLLAPFAVGAGIFVVALFGYNDIAFGGPLEFSYDYHHGSSGGEPLGWPKWEYFEGLMFSLHRGFLTTSPWYLLLFPGALLLAGRRGYRGLAACLMAILVFRIGLMSGYEWWTGDWGFGPRHLVPIMGLATVLSAVAIERWRYSFVGRALTVGLVLVGILYNQIQTAFIAELPPAAKNPMMDVVVPFYRDGLPSPNLLTVFTESTSLWTLLPLGVVAGALTVFVAVRGLGWMRAYWKRAATVALSLLPTVAFGYYVYTTGPSWPEKRRKSFLENRHITFERDRKFHRKDK
jgi:hypothetical protein